MKRAGAGALALLALGCGAPRVQPASTMPLDDQVSAAKRAAALLSIAASLHADGQHQRAAHGYRRAIEADTSQVQMYAHRGYQDALLALGRRDELIEEYRRLAEKPGLDAPLYAYLYSRLLDDPRQALAVLERAPRSAVEGAVAWLAYGMAVRFEELGQDDAALDHYLRAAEQESFWPEPAYGAARLLQQRERFAEAAEQYRRAALWGAPLSEYFYGWIASLYRLQSEHPEEKTLAALLDACRAAKNEHPRHVEFFLLEGQVVGRFQDENAGLLLFNKALAERIGDETQARVAYAWFRNHEHPRLAARVLEAALKSWPADEFFAREAGAQYLRAGRLDDARAWYEACLARFPQSAHFPFALAALLEQVVLPEAASDQARAHTRARAYELYRACLTLEGEERDLARERLAALDQEHE